MCCVKVCQGMTEYGVHFHRVLPEKRSQTGIMLGVYSKGVLIFEVLNGNRTPVLRFPWRETKKISFTVPDYFFSWRNMFVKDLGGIECYDILPGSIFRKI